MEAENWCLRKRIRLLGSDIAEWMQLGCCQEIIYVSFFRLFSYVLFCFKFFSETGSPYRAIE